MLWILSIRRQHERNEALQASSHHDVRSRGDNLDDSICCTLPLVNSCFYASLRKLFRSAFHLANVKVEGVVHILSKFNFLSLADIHALKLELLRVGESFNVE